MKKPLKKKSITYKTDSGQSHQMQEPGWAYAGAKFPVLKLKDFTFQEFKKIADKAPFTQAEWSDILHISERTLQRYAKSNGHFAPINAERALQIARVLDEGKQTFGSTLKFYQWLKSEPQMLEGSLGFDTLTTQDGIQKVLLQLGRIQQGILA